MNAEKLLRSRRNLKRLHRYWLSQAEYWAKVSGFGGLHCSCEFYVEKILRAQQRARHYAALLKLAHAALARIAPAHRSILYKRYILGQDVSTIAGDDDANVRALWRRIDRALVAYEKEVERLLSLRTEPLRGKAHS